MYGIEFSSATGAPYVLPDNNPYTLHERFHFRDPGPPGAYFIDTNIPESVNLLVFWEADSIYGASYFGMMNASFQKVSGQWRICFFKTGEGNEAPGTFNMVAYVFTDRIVKTSNDGVGYGIEVFDSKGNLILDGERKPLRIEFHPRAKYPNYVYVPHRVAVLSTITDCYDPRGSGGTYITYNLGGNDGNGSPVIGFFREGIWHDAIFGRVGEVGSYPATVACIKVSDYT